MDAAENRLADANMALRRFDHHHVVERLQKRPPGEKSEEGEEGDPAGNPADAPKRVGFCAKAAIDFRIYIDMRLQRAASAFSDKTTLQYANQCAHDLRKAAHRLSRIIERDAEQLLDDCQLDDALWLRAKALLLAAIRREPPRAIRRTVGRGRRRPNIA